MQLKILGNYVRSKFANNCLNIHERVEVVDRNKKMVPLLLLLSCESSMTV